MKKIAFVCDSSIDIGSGHLLRCFAIAEKFVENKWDVYFVGTFVGPSWINNLNKLFKFSSLKDVKHLKFDLLFIDSYNTNLEKIKNLENLCKNIFFILDDKTPFFIGYSYFSVLPKKYLNLEQNIDNLYCGFEYTLIRKSLKNLRNRIIDSKYVPPNIALMSGGVGRTKYLSTFTSELNFIDNSKNVFIFSQEKFKINNEINYTFIKPSIHALDNIQETHAVISTASVTSLEILFLGIPLAIYKIYDNQSSYFDLLNQLKLSFGIAAKTLNDNVIIDTDSLSVFLEYAKQNYFRSINSESVVDGYGVDRVFEISTNS